MSGPRGSEAKAERGGHSDERSRGSPEEVGSGSRARGVDAAGTGDGGTEATDMPPFAGRTIGTGSRLLSTMAAALTLVGTGVCSAGGFATAIVRCEDGTPDEGATTNDAA